MGREVGGRSVQSSEPRATLRVPSGGPVGSFGGGSGRAKQIMGSPSAKSSPRSHFDIAMGPQGGLRGNRQPKLCTANRGARRWQAGGSPISRPSDLGAMQFLGAMCNAMAQTGGPRSFISARVRALAETRGSPCEYWSIHGSFSWPSQRNRNSRAGQSWPRGWCCVIKETIHRYCSKEQRVFVLNSSLLRVHAFVFDQSLGVQCWRRPRHLGGVGCTDSSLQSRYSMGGRPYEMKCHHLLVAVDLVAATPLACQCPVNHVSVSYYTWPSLNRPLLSSDPPRLQNALPACRVLR